MKRKIIEIGDPILRARAAEVVDPWSHDIKELIQDMLATLQNSRGVGLAAPQIGVSLRVIIIASKPTARYPNAPLIEPIPMINPSIEWASPDIVKDWESCLSIPGLTARVPRASAIRIRYIEHKSSKEVSADFEGFLARICQHEYDHLEGIMFIDRATPQFTNTPGTTLVTKSNTDAA